MIYCMRKDSIFNKRKKYYSFNMQPVQKSAMELKKKKRSHVSKTALNFSSSCTHILRCGPLHPIYAVMRIKFQNPRATNLVGKHSINWATSLTPINNDFELLFFKTISEFTECLRGTVCVNLDCPYIMCLAVTVAGHYKIIQHNPRGAILKWKISKLDTRSQHSHTKF